MPLRICRYGSGDCLDYWISEGFYGVSLSMLLQDLEVFLICPLYPLGAFCSWCGSSSLPNPFFRSLARNVESKAVVILLVYRKEEIPKVNGVKEQERIA